MRLQLDLMDELRTTAKQRLARYQNRMAQYYNSRVHHRDFQVGDLVLRKVMGAVRDPTQGKLGPNWEGPYRVTSWQRKGTYHLETLEGQKLPHPWNIEHLRKYYQQERQHKDQRSLSTANFSLTPHFYRLLQLFYHLLQFFATISFFWF